MKFLTAKNNQGFTLLELIIVMAIIGILASTILLTPGILDNRNKAVDTGKLDTAAKIQQQIYTYNLTTGNTYPAGTTTDTLLDGILLDMKAKGIVSNETTFASNTFYLKYSGEGTPNIGFNLSSTQFQSTSRCFQYNSSLNTTVSADTTGTPCVGNSRFYVPFSGKLGGGR